MQSQWEKSLAHSKHSYTFRLCERVNFFPFKSKGENAAHQSSAQRFLPLVIPPQERDCQPGVKEQPCRLSLGTAGKEKEKQQKWEEGTPPGRRRGMHVPTPPPSGQMWSYRSGGAGRGGLGAQARRCRGPCGERR